jgi:transcription elongation factor Elf1
MKNINIGQTINGLLFLKEATPKLRNNGHKIRTGIFKCSLCNCEKEYIVGALNSKKTVGCGCLLNRIQLVEGDSIGNFLFIKDLGRKEFAGRFGRYGLFKCNFCNSEKTDLLQNIKNYVSCGCRKVELSRAAKIKHGLSKHPLYCTWASIRERCFSGTESYKKNYAGRGIIFSDEFLNNPKAFIEYLESLPFYHLRKSQNLSLDRIDNDGNYERGNLRWATKIEQSHNSRKYKGGYAASKLKNYKPQSTFLNKKY